MQKYNTGIYTIPEIRIGRMILPNNEVAVLSGTLYPKDKLIVGFMGSAGKERDINGNEFKPTDEQKELAEKIGRIAAERSCILSNGALWGVPYFAARGAKKANGYTIGISPSKDHYEHTGEKNKPIKHFDLLFYVGLGYKPLPAFDMVFRDVFNTLYPDIIISMDGRWGTLDEDTHAIELGKTFVPVKDSGGTTGELVSIIEKGVIKKETGAKIIIAESANIEEAIDIAIKEARKRWAIEGRKENLFSEIISELEEVMARRRET